MQTSERIQDKALIGGQWVSAVSGRTFEVRNPSTDELIAEVPEGDKADVARAIDAASAALPAWRALPGLERSKALRRLNDLMHRDADHLARLMTLELGKPFAESRGEVVYAAGFIEWSAEEARPSSRSPPTSASRSSSRPSA